MKKVKIKFHSLENFIADGDELFKASRKWHVLSTSFTRKPLKIGKIALVKDKPVTSTLPGWTHELTWTWRRWDSSPDCCFPAIPPQNSSGTPKGLWSTAPFPLMAMNRSESGTFSHIATGWGWSYLLGSLQLISVNKQIKTSHTTKHMQIWDRKLHLYVYVYI